MAYEGASYIRDSTVYRSMPELLVRGIIFTYNLIHPLDAYHTIDMQAALFMNSTHRYARMLCVALAILRFSSSACMTMSTWNRGCKHRVIKLDWDSKVKPTGVWHCRTKSPQSLQWRTEIWGTFYQRKSNGQHCSYTILHIKNILHSPQNTLHLLDERYMDIDYITHWIPKHSEDVSLISP